MSGEASKESDGTLVTAVLAGDRSAFASIVRRYQKPLFRVALGRLGRREWAEDAVQETFLAVFRSLHTYDSRYSFRTWLWTILLNQCRRQQKKRARRPKISVWTDRPNSDAPLGAGIEDAVGCPSTLLSEKERRGMLNRLLGRLSPVQAEAVRLRFFGGMKFHEISVAMGCSLSTAKNRVRWGLERLSQWMETERIAERIDQPGRRSPVPTTSTNDPRGTDEP